MGDEIDVVVLSVEKEPRRLSLGHKQLEENPWDTFETIFTPDSVHEGTVVELYEKGAVIALPYGVEAFATPRHLVKEDGTTAKLDEKLPFKVIDFNRNSKRIIVSHSRVFEDVKREAERADHEEKRNANEAAKSTMRRINADQEKTTLGDISELAQLKENLEKGEKDADKKDEAAN